MLVYADRDMAQQFLLRYFKKPQNERNGNVSVTTSSVSSRPAAANIGSEDRASASRLSREGGASAAVDDLSAIDEPPTQPRLRSFPTTMFGNKARCFSPHWYEKFRFLEYSIQKDSVFCQMCRHFGERGREETFREGYKDWKHLAHACDKHQNSKGHRFSLEKFNNYKQTSSSERGTVLHQIHNVEGDIIQRNRAHIKVILDVLLTCAKQEIPLRGNRENPDDESTNVGNFLEMIKLLCRHSPEIQTRMETIPANAKMLSHDIQNELLDAAATLLLRRIKDEVKTEGTYFAILADECKDISKKQLVAVCLRYVHKGTVRERVVGLVDTGDMTAASIARKIKDVLTPFELDPRLCVGFGFDGASVMSGHKGGVQAILKETYPHAQYVHCHSHRLNLVLAAVARTSQDASKFFDTLNNLHTFMCGSERHARFVDIQKEMRPDDRPLELERGCDTRWSSRSTAVSKVSNVLATLMYN